MSTNKPKDSTKDDEPTGYPLLGLDGQYVRFVTPEEEAVRRKLTEKDIFIDRLVLIFLKFMGGSEAEKRRVLVEAIPELEYSVRRA